MSLALFEFNFTNLYSELDLLSFSNLYFRSLDAIESGAPPFLAENDLRVARTKKSRSALYFHQVSAGGSCVGQLEKKSASQIAKLLSKTPFLLSSANQFKEQKSDKVQD